METEHDITIRPEVADAIKIANRAAIQGLTSEEWAETRIREALAETPTRTEEEGAA